MPINPAAILATLTFSSSVKTYWVAYSGGLDSHVLLHALVKQQLQLGNAHIAAVHINHGLSPNAAQWSAHCQQQCDALEIPLTLISVNARAQPGESPEAAARHARYQAFREILQTNDCLLTAHHQDDQAETLLLQLLRGAGPKGLAAMPLWSIFGPTFGSAFGADVKSESAEGWQARPLLSCGRDELIAYAQQHQLQWIDDESNFDIGFDRNFLRHDIMPTLKQRFPSAAATISRSARLCAEAAALSAEVASSDLQTVITENGQLSVKCLQQLQELRGRNVLHHWIHASAFASPTAAQLQRIWEDVVNAAEDACPVVTWPGGEIRRYRDELFLGAPLTKHDVTRCLEWRVPHALNIYALGTLTAQQQKGAGIACRKVEAKKVEVRFRQGGEQMRLCGREGTHALKKLFQESGVPPWQRERIPLIYIEGELAAVAGLWVACDFAAQDDEPGWRLEWQPTSQ